ncbi:MAG: DoxX family protein [Caldilineae bacterium]|nr:MAG: DoxX family protein [Caldilineae bacterium]
MDILHLIGRIIYGGFFIMMGLNHFMQAKAMIPYAQAKGVPAPQLAVYGTGVLLLIGGLSILLAFQTVIGVIALVIFLLPTSIMMHNFWAVDDPQQKMVEMTQFMKNMALMGAALIFLAIQTWPMGMGG